MLSYPLWLLRLDSIYRISAALSDFSVVALIICSLANLIRDTERVEIAFLPLKACAHVEIMKVIVVLCLTLYRESVWPYDIFEPMVTQDFWKRYPILRFNDEHAHYQIFSLRWNIDWKTDFSAHLTLEKALHALSRERHCTLQHYIQENAQAPNVYIEPWVLAVTWHLRSQVCRRAALLVDDICLCYQSAYTKIADLYATFSI